MNARGIVLLVCVLVGALGLARPEVFAQTPTEEPTKRPYVFPTPIFIPTYPNDTPQPLRPTPTLPASTPSAATEEQTYIVQPGDSLWTIAHKVYGNGAKYPLIAQANNLTATTRLRTGMVLKIPGAPNPSPPTSVAPVAPTPTLTVMPTPLPTLTPTITPTVLPDTGGTASLFDNAETGLRFLAALSALGAIVFALLAYLTYARAKRLQLIEKGKPPIRLH